MGLELKQHRHHQEDMEEVLFGDSELVHYVRHALLSAQEGDIDNYNQLLGVLHHSGRLAPDKVALLVTSLQALSGAASYIDIAYHDALLNSIFGMNMWNYGPDVMEALVELITALAAANGKYIDSCLDMLVSNFMPPFYMLDLLKVPHGLAKKEQVLSRIHKALEDITNLVPLAGMRLSSVVVHRLPKTFGNNAEKDRMTIRTEMFVENMLRLESGSIKQFVGSRMLMAVVDTLVELDVAIGWDDILRDDSSRGVFAIELEDENGGDDDDEDDDAEFPKALTHKYLEKSVIADLLDSLMVRTFEHLESCANNNRLNEVFEILVDSFMLTILNTYKSKFAQFVMFYACALDPENCGTKFANTLLDRFLHGENPLTRMSAVAYLASYLARGKFISVASVANILKRLVDWCSEYCRSQYGGINAQAHRVFYSGFQAIMYVLCFRMGSMMDVPGLKSQILLPIQPILKHNLEPLKVCLPSIVKEFLKQAKAANLFTISKKFVFSNILESDLSREFGGMERMDTFFPFDPCLLRKSDSGYIRPNFVYWKYVRTTYYSANEEYSSDEEIAEDFGDNDMEEEIQLNFSRQDDDDLDEEFGNAMSKMSITPRDGLLKKHGKDRMQMPSRIRPSTSPQFL